MYMYTYIHIYMYTYIHTYGRTYTHTYISTCVRTYIHIHIHSIHIHIHTHSIHIEQQPHTTARTDGRQPRPHTAHTPPPPCTLHTVPRRRPRAYAWRPPAALGRAWTERQGLGRGGRRAWEPRRVCAPSSDRLMPPLPEPLSGTCVCVCPSLRQSPTDPMPGGPRSARLRARRAT